MTWIYAEKGIVYNKLADIAFNSENYAVAEGAYKEVIKNSLTKEKIEKTKEKRKKRK